MRGALGATDVLEIIKLPFPPIAPPGKGRPPPRVGKGQYLPARRFERPGWARNRPRRTNVSDSISAPGAYRFPPSAG